jgi:hypothetical protein
MSLAEWEKVLRIIKEHGFNHVRYHTWCPPEAAFEAADRLGLYLQPEAPAWVDDWGINTATRPQGIGRDAAAWNFIRSEAHRISEAYGNHPSFLMFTIGNEFGENHTDWQAVDQLVGELKQLDPRRLCSGCTARRRVPADDYWITHHSGAPTRGVGPANTQWDFSSAVAASPVPVISHETGQRPVFPDYRTLLPKFRGPLLPLNLERYQRALAASGQGVQAQAFVAASARFQFVQYKAEHEAMLRTPGLGGYQLLMLNDFTGQSEALVGVLDPFWESKGVVRAEEVREWNAPTVLLARFPKFVWTSDETLPVEIDVAHYGMADLSAKALEWSVAAPSGKVIAKGRRKLGDIRTGGLTRLETSAIALGAIKAPTALTLRARLGRASNHWNLWVYPSAPAESEPAGITVVKALDDTTLKALQGGAKVLLLAHGLKNGCTAKAGFESVYWSAGWWGNRFSSLGILCDPQHPALAGFPNDGHSDWQWRDLCSGATTILLEDTPAGLRPIVQLVPDFHFNVLLAHLFEAKVGKGSLVVCGYDLINRLETRPAARQFRQSLLRYMQSPAFAPAQVLPVAWVERALAPAGLARRGARIVDVDSEDAANGNVAANAIDGDPGTIWHTRWQPASDPMPHTLVIDLGKELSLKGVTYLPRPDQANGRIAEVEVYCSLTADAWGAPEASAKWPNSQDLQSVVFATPSKARYLRLVVRSEVNGNAFAAVAELGILD